MPSATLKATALAHDILTNEKLSSLVPLLLLCSSSNAATCKDTFHATSLVFLSLLSSDNSQKDWISKNYTLFLQLLQDKLPSHAWELVPVALDQLRHRVIITGTTAFDKVLHAFLIIGIFH
jgi:hypothetical protein